jgi:large subunit ribosomal protein L22
MENKKIDSAKNLDVRAEIAKAKMVNLPISTKHSIEISNYLRYKTTSAAIRILEKVTKLEKAIPFKRFTNDIGHKSGMRSGRFPVKAAKSFLQLVKSCEKNAEDVGLNTDSLKITHILANKASIPMTGGRTKGATKRTHIEIKVSESVGNAKKSNKLNKTKKAKENKENKENRANKVNKASENLTVDRNKNKSEHTVDKVKSEEVKSEDKKSEQTTNKLEKKNELVIEKPSEDQQKEIAGDSI